MSDCRFGVSPVTILILILILILIPVTDSRHDGKCNICAFHEEIHAFEDWIFVRLSSLVLASEWTTNQNKFIAYSSETGQSVAQNRQKKKKKKKSFEFY